MDEIEKGETITKETFELYFKSQLGLNGVFLKPCEERVKRGRVINDQSAGHGKEFDVEEYKAKQQEEYKA